MPEELVHKTLKSDFPNNDTISMRSPSSNAIIWWGTFSLKNRRLHINMYTVRFHANGIEIKVFDFKVIDSAVIKCFNCVYNYQIYNLAETKRNKIFGRAGKFWNLVRMVLYKVNLTNNMKYILSFLVVFFKVISVLTLQGTNWRKYFQS